MLKRGKLYSKNKNLHQATIKKKVEAIYYSEIYTQKWQISY